MANLIDNPSLDTGAAANPWIPDGWANAGGALALDAGDSEIENTVIHSGVASMQFNTGASAEGIVQQITAPVGSFVKVSMWSLCDGSAGFTIGGLDATQLRVQSSATVYTVATPHTAVWTRTTEVFCVVAANPSIYITADAGAAGARYIDDISVALDTAVSLTATPASQANSLETTGLRVDGRDTLTQTIPAGYFGATWGWCRWNWTPRHSAANLETFGVQYATIFHVYGNASNYIRAFASSPVIRLEFNDGGGIHSVDWNCAGLIVAGVTYKMEVRYTNAAMWLIVNNGVVATITTSIGFAVTPVTVYWGPAGGTRQPDATYAIPS